MAIPLTINPIFYRSNGCDPLTSAFGSRLRQMIETGDVHGSSPRYNIIKQDDQHFTISVMVPGFTESELSIATRQNALIVTGTHDEPSQDHTADYVHQGFSKRAFESTFRLGEHMKVKGAHLQNGLLHIELERAIPEEEKPQLIPISTAGAASKPTQN